MNNRKRAPLLAHLLAAPAGMGLDSELAKDFWFGHEEPWSATQNVQSRLAKLAYMYMASAIAHVGIPLLIFAVIFELVRTPQGMGFQFSVFSSVYSFRFGVTIVKKYGI